MEFRVNLLTPVTYSREDEIYFDDICERFANELKEKIERELKINCKYYKQKGFADVNDFDIFEKRYLQDSEYVIIIASPTSKEVLEDFLTKLSLFLSEKRELKERYLLVTVGDMTVNSTIIRSVDLSLNYNEDCNERSWTKLYDHIEKMRTHCCEEQVINVEDINNACGRLWKVYVTQNCIKVLVDQDRDGGSIDRNNVRNLKVKIIQKSVAEQGWRLYVSFYILFYILKILQWITVNMCHFLKKKSVKIHFKDEIIKMKDQESIRRDVGNIHKTGKNIEILLDYDEKNRQCFQKNRHLFDQIKDRIMIIIITLQAFFKRWRIFHYIFYILSFIYKPLYHCILYILKSMAKIKKKIIKMENQENIKNNVGNIYQNEKIIQIPIEDDENSSQHLQQNEDFLDQPSIRIIRISIIPETSLTRWRILYPILYILVFIHKKLYRCFLYVLKCMEIKRSNITKSKPCGFRNTSETCYMNSMMQALASSSKLINNISSTLKANSYSETFRIFINTLQFINDPLNSDEVDKATSMLISFTKNVKWNRASQQDAFQLLSYFINFIQKDAAVNKMIMPPKFKILHTFTEDSKYNKVQDHLALALPLCGTFKELPGVPLQRLMDKFFSPSIIDDGPYATQLYLFQEAPEVMILHIQANVWSDDRGEYIKPKYYIEYEEQLKYTFKIQKKVDASEEVSVEVTYQLMAVVHHMGSMSGGHYITYRRHGQRWYLTNDKQVDEVQFKGDVVPYIMVYEKKEEYF